MTNKYFGLGILVMALVFGMTVVGCDDDSASAAYSWTFANTSNYTVNVQSPALTPSSFSISPNGGSKTATSSTDTFDWIYTPVNNVQVTQSESGKVIYFTNR